ncbi:16699_t:CDS:2, partial [Racocetra fulgida]
KRVKIIRKDPLIHGKHMRNQVDNPVRENVGNQNMTRPDVRFLEFTEEETCDGKDYLEVELLGSVDKTWGKEKRMNQLIKYRQKGRG